MDFLEKHLIMSPVIAIEDEISCPSSVNLHLWCVCDQRCKYCFVRFPKGMKSLSKEDWMLIIDELASAGVKKVNFAGGEPTLCPFLVELIDRAKNRGMNTSIISNGTGITEWFLDRINNTLDTIGLSVDSGIESVQKLLGRGNGKHVSRIRELADQVHGRGISLKINTVVTSMTWQEDMRGLIQELQPDRWKVFQFLPVKGQNDTFAHLLSIKASQFHHFLDIHSSLHPVAENNDLMTGSYCMIDPLGRIYQKIWGKYIYSENILKIGFVDAVKSVGFDEEKFLERGANYFESR
ncbi:MAG: viperin family antiviral radical SAM protein [Promethearchaeota archaeon]